MKTIVDAVNRMKKTLGASRDYKFKSALERMNATLIRVDAEFKETEHPRSEDGKFGSKTGAKSGDKPSSRKPTKPKVTSVDKALKEKDLSESLWHKGIKAWDNAPADVMDAVAKTKKLSDVTSYSSGSYYVPGRHYVNMRQPLNPDDRTAVVIWRHEFGHAMDWNGADKAQSASCTAAMQYDVSTEDKQIKINSAYNDLMGDKTIIDPKFREAEGLLLSDFVCALTNTRVGYGHSAEYFSRPGYRECEMFANYVSLISGKDGDEYRKVLHKMAPFSCGSFDIIIQKLSGKKARST